MGYFCSLESRRHFMHMTLTTEPTPRTAQKLQKIWPRVFVVEPDYDTALTIKTAIENGGKTWEQYDVMITNGDWQSLADTQNIRNQIVHWQADIVIIEYLDVPGADWLIEQLKKLPEPPIVIVTSHHSNSIKTDEFKASLQREFDIEDYVRKPFNPHIIMEVVNQHWLPKTILA